MLHDYFFHFNFKCLFYNCNYVVNQASGCNQSRGFYVECSLFALYLCYSHHFTAIFPNLFIYLLLILWWCVYVLQHEWCGFMCGVVEMVRSATFVCEERLEIEPRLNDEFSHKRGINLWVSRLFHIIYKSKFVYNGNGITSWICVQLQFERWPFSGQKLTLLFDYYAMNYVCTILV